MTTKHSPLRVLKAQADRIAAAIKAFERGEKIDIPFGQKLEVARSRESVKFGIVMDDKVITIDMPWAVIRATGEVGLAEYILKQMRETRETIN